MSKLHAAGLWHIRRSIDRRDFSSLTILFVAGPNRTRVMYLVPVLVRSSPLITTKTTQRSKVAGTLGRWALACCFRVWSYIYLQSRNRKNLTWRDNRPDGWPN